MGMKFFAGAVALGLLLAYVVPLVVKLQEPALGAVVAVGVIMMLVDLAQSLRAKDEQGY